MVNRSGSTKRRLNETQHREFKTHKMGMQISRGIYLEESQEKHLRVGEKGTRADHPGFSPAERERSGGGASDGGSCAHAAIDPPEVLGVRGGGGLSRARVPSRSHEGSWIGQRTLWGRTFGRGDITCPRWGGMKRRSESTLRSRRKKIRGSNSCSCSSKRCQRKLARPL